MAGRGGAARSAVIAAIQYCRAWGRDFDSNWTDPGEHILRRWTYAQNMLRFLATLAFAVSFDIILTGGKYVGAVDQVAVALVQRF